jgi:hypothetical protein
VVWGRFFIGSWLLQRSGLWGQSPSVEPKGIAAAAGWSAAAQLCKDSARSPLPMIACWIIGCGWPPELSLSAAEVDGEVESWLKEAYAVGEQKHLDQNV